MEFTFDSYNKYTHKGISEALKECNYDNATPIIICIGSDLVLGDSLGPLVGTLLKKKKVAPYIYGTLNYPITAKEIEYAKTCLRQMHPNSIEIAIDAAVGTSDDIGIIKVTNKGLKPGIGINKKLGVIGDISIIGVVSQKSANNFDLFNMTRLNLVYKMAEKIADGIEDYLVNHIEQPTLEKLQDYSEHAKENLFGA